jgi:hypothetical protein
MSVSRFLGNMAQGKDFDESVEATKQDSALYQLSGQGASDVAKEASETAAEGEMAKLEYLKEREALPTAFRDAAMRGLGSEYGMTFDNEGNIIPGASTIEERALASPMYTGQLEAGEQAIGRAGSATGRLRGGATPTALGENAQNAYLNAYNQQLQGLNQFAYGGGNNANAIGQSISNVGGLLSQGQVASAQAQQQGMGNLAGLGSAALLAFSDPRMKKDVKVTGTYKGVDWCAWKWNALAEKFGLKGDGAGVMADQVADKHPDCVGEVCGYLAVDYVRLENAQSV